MMPRIVVTMKPLGLSGPGERNFAITPAMNPMMMVHKILIGAFLVGSDRQRRTAQSVRGESRERRRGTPPWHPAFTGGANRRRGFHGRGIDGTRFRRRAHPVLDGAGHLPRAWPRSRRRRSPAPS